MPIRNLRRTACSAIAFAVAAFGVAQGFVADEVLVKFHPGRSLYDLAGPIAVNAKVVQQLPFIGVLRLQIPRGWGVMNTVRQLRRMAYVQFAEPNYIVRAIETPNDPLYPQQWNLPLIEADLGWDLTHGSSGVVIAIIDTGVDLDHPDLQAKLVPGADFVQEDDTPDDDHGHGTHVAGIAAAATNNSIGIAAVGYDCRIMPIKALNSLGNGSTSDIANGIGFAVSNGAKVVSLSLGSTSNSSTMSSAVNAAWNAGVLVVAAAGNESTSAQSFPAAYANVIAVGATDRNDVRALFTNFGPWVDVAAPGVEIASTYIDAQYAIMSGTSMSTPHVAGLGGLLWAFLGTTTPVATIRQRIEDNTVPVGTWLAKGRIDVRRAILNLGPPAFIRRAAVPTSLTVEAGTVLSGNLASVLVSDDIRLNLSSTRVGAGRSARYFVDALTNWSGQRLALEAAVEAQTTPGGLLRVSYWNWPLNRWDLIASKSLGGSDRVHVFTSSNTQAYVGAGDQVAVRVERTESRNLLFWLRTDRVEITAVSLE